MGRLINTDALDVHSLPMDMGGCLLIDDVTELIANAPTIDPVKHGKWTRSYETGSQDYDTMRNIRYRCSECNKKAMWDTEYCPHCGSRMDGE